MPLRKGYPARNYPVGICDSYDAEDSFPGSCKYLTNFVFDRDNQRHVSARPGYLRLTNFSGFTTPGFVSVKFTVGSRVYGMIATGRNAGQDEPFCFDQSTGLFVTISNVLAGNTPTSPATSGDWTPPTMDMIGTKILVTHPGFNGVGTNFFGVIDVSNPAAPAWSAANTGTNVLAAVPTAVAQFANRAWFVVGNTLAYTDVLTLNRTNASQALTLGASDAILGLKGLPLGTSSQGVLQALLAFKSDSVWQITGDAATSNLGQNELTSSEGCRSPRAIAAGDDGVYFPSLHGLYLVNLLGAVIPVTNRPGAEMDLVTPFSNIVTPSRAAGAYANGVYRIFMSTVFLNVAQSGDFWFDTHKRRWCGPHTFAYDSICEFQGNFVLSSSVNPGKLYTSVPFYTNAAVFTDDGAAYQCTSESTNFCRDNMQQKSCLESTIELIPTLGASYNISMLDGDENTLNSVTISPSGAGYLWNNHNWGSGLWTSGNPNPDKFLIPWTAPLASNEMSLRVDVTPNARVGFGPNLHRLQNLGYTLK